MNYCYKLVKGILLFCITKQTYITITKISFLYKTGGYKTIGNASFNNKSNP